MLYHWLNKQNNSRLIVFLAGWSFDFYPFEFWNCKGSDFLFVYDYNSIEKSDLPDLTGNYSERILVTWSMGVFAGYILRDLFEDFNRKTAVNGTPYPVHDTLGIPLKPFLLTLRHAKTGLEGKFYQNIFDKTEEFERYSKTPVRRTIENRESELKSLYKRINEEKIDYKNFYDFALISANDKIIPTKNQINFWQDRIPFKILESGHFPFYNFESPEEITELAATEKCLCR